MRILWFNWRDIKNPAAGGAEVYTHEVTRHLAKMGYKVTLFTASFSASAKEEIIDGVRIVREGGRYSVYDKAKSYYKRNKELYDIIIDEINTKPFFTPKYVKDKPIIALIHHVPRKGLSYELKFPLNFIYPYYLREKWLSYYKNVPTITVSNCSKNDLKDLDYKKIYVVKAGISVTPLSNMPHKEPVATIAFIGRLKRHKLPDHAIKAFNLIKKEIPEAKMWIIGDGYMKKNLEKMKISNVHFYGHVKEDLKFHLLSRAHLILLPAVKEGWGLVVTESNAMGTPVIAYDVSGLRESVRDGETGVLVREKSPQSLSQAATCLLKDRTRLCNLSRNAINYSRQFSWDKTAQAFDNILKFESKYKWKGK